MLPHVVRSLLHCRNRVFNQQVRGCRQLLLIRSLLRLALHLLGLQGLLRLQRNLSLLRLLRLQRLLRVHL